MSAKVVNGTVIQQYTAADTIYHPDGREEENKSWYVSDVHFSIGTVTYEQMYTHEKTSTVYYPYCLKFTTPHFSGTSKNIRISLRLAQNYNPDERLDIPLRFAVCKSDSNKNMYRKTHSNVSDENQVVSGVWTIPSLQYTSASYENYECVINSNDIKPNATYYFLLWGYRDEVDLAGSVRTHGNHLKDISIVIEYYDHIAHIDIGSEIKPCQCYIDNGVNWIPIIPHIDNGSEWKPCV